MKKYLSLEELKKDYPVGKVSVEGQEDSYSCSKKSKSFISFCNYFESNPFVTNKKEDKNTLTYSIKHIIKLWKNIFIKLIWENIILLARIMYFNLIKN